MTMLIPATEYWSCPNCEARYAPKPDYHRCPVQLSPPPILATIKRQQEQYDQRKKALDRITQTRIKIKREIESKKRMEEPRAAALLDAAYDHYLDVHEWDGRGFNTLQASRDRLVNAAMHYAKVRKLRP